VAKLLFSTLVYFPPETISVIPTDILYLQGEPAATALCHCRDCKKWAGSSFSSNVVVHEADFKVTKGTPKFYTLNGNSGQPYPHFFCGSEYFAPLSNLICDSQFMTYRQPCPTIIPASAKWQSKISLTQRIDCGSSLFGKPESMPGITLVRAGILDGGKGDVDMGVEYFAKDRESFVKPVEGAVQCSTMT
jgi:hypothetical protein